MRQGDSGAFLRWKEYHVRSPQWEKFMESEKTTKRVVYEGERWCHKELEKYARVHVI